MANVGMAQALRWRVSKLISAHAQNNHFQCGKLHSLTAANGYI